MSKSTKLMIAVALAFAWTAGAVAFGGWLGWMARHRSITKKLQAQVDESRATGSVVDDFTAEEYKRSAEHLLRVIGEAP